VTSEQTAALSEALAKAQAQMTAATFNRVNPHFKSKYADLASVLDAIRKPLADNALSVTQTTEIRDQGLVLVTTLRHSTGQWIASEYPLPTGVKPQELGSALTYARRYSLSAIACIAADEDDDAEGARTSGQVSSAPRAKESPIKPQTVEPPVHPETGEVSPHSIASPGPAAAWAGLVIAAVNMAGDAIEVGQWKNENSAMLNDLRAKAPKIADKVDAAIVAKLQSFERVAA
jgi:hypothetical protein